MFSATSPGLLILWDLLLRSPWGGKMCVIADRLCLSLSPPSHSFIHSFLDPVSPSVICPPAHSKAYLSTQSASLGFPATCKPSSWALSLYPQSACVSLLHFTSKMRSSVFDTMSVFPSNPWPLWGQDLSCSSHPEPLLLSPLHHLPLPSSPLWLSLTVIWDVYSSRSFPSCSAEVPSARPISHSL